MNELKIEIPNLTTVSKFEIEQISTLVNTVYKNSEGDFWPTDGSYSRTTFIEISEFISKNEIILAKKNSLIVGSVHVYPISNTVLGFGMLSSSLAFRKIGIGNLLLSAVEKFALKNNYYTIQLELLKPINYLHPEKEFLEKWYQKWGYTYYETIPYQKLYFKQAHMLKFPCKFDIFRKQL